MTSFLGANVVDARIIIIRGPLNIQFCNEPGGNAVDKAHEKVILEEIWLPNATKYTVVRSGRNK
jgi:hypothetical protein